MPRLRPSPISVDSDQEGQRCRVAVGHLPITIANESDVSAQQATVSLFPREEALSIASLLAFIGGYLEAYTWIVHHVFANAQSANLVFLWVNMTGGEWEAAFRYVPPLLAFVIGVVLACWLRRVATQRASRISTLTEIVFLFIVAIMHNRLPEVAGTLGLSLVAAFQMVSFPRVEGWTYNSVMVTSNFRQTVEGLFAAFAGSGEVRPFRRPCVRNHVRCLWRRGRHRRVCDGNDTRIQPGHSRAVARHRPVAL
jgi:uncharacterized membrane protein YoaK (UPF0700 family)